MGASGLFAIVYLLKGPWVERVLKLSFLIYVFETKSRSLKQSIILDQAAHPGRSLLRYGMCGPRSNKFWQLEYRKDRVHMRTRTAFFLGPLFVLRWDQNRTQAAIVRYLARFRPVLRSKNVYDTSRKALLQSLKKYSELSERNGDFDLLNQASRVEGAIGPESACTTFLTYW